MTLRERKKALTRTAIEEAGLRLFLERGYEATTLDDICEAALVSRRTFFRYFTSKEDLVLAQSRSEFEQALEHIRHRPRDEPVGDSLLALFEGTTPLFDQDRDHQLLRMRLLSGTPALAGSYLRVLTDFEQLLRGFIAERTGAPAGSAQVRLVAAATLTAFRVSVETWIDGDGAPPLGPLAHRNLTRLLSGTLPELVGGGVRPVPDGPSGTGNR